METARDKERRLQALAELVDEAWRKLQAGDHRASTINAYTVAFTRWSTEAMPAKGQGRPAAGDGMTSTQRAAAARQRATDNAARWASIAPMLRKLRRAVDAGDNADIIAIAKAIADTEKDPVPYEYEVSSDNTDSGRAVMRFYHGHSRDLAFLAFISREAVEDGLQINSIHTAASLNLVVEMNKDLLASLAIDMYDQGIHQSYGSAGTVYPLVVIRSVDLEASGIKLDGSVLEKQGRV